MTEKRAKIRRASAARTPLLPFTKWLAATTRRPGRTTRASPAPSTSSAAGAPVAPWSISRRAARCGAAPRRRAAPAGARRRSATARIPRRNMWLARTGCRACRARHNVSCLRSQGLQRDMPSWVLLHLRLRSRPSSEYHGDACTGTARVAAVPCEEQADDGQAKQCMELMPLSNLMQAVNCSST